MSSNKAEGGKPTQASDPNGGPPAVQSASGVPASGGGDGSSVSSAVKQTKGNGGEGKKPFKTFMKESEASKLERLNRDRIISSLMRQSKVYDEMASFEGYVKSKGKQRVSEVTDQLGSLGHAFSGLAGSQSGAGDDRAAGDSGSIADTSTSAGGGGQVSGDAAAGPAAKMQIDGGDAEDAKGKEVPMDPAAREKAAQEAKAAEEKRLREAAEARAELAKAKSKFLLDQIRPILEVDSQEGYLSFVHFLKSLPLKEDTIRDTRKDFADLLEQGEYVLALIRYVQNRDEDNSFTRFLAGNSPKAIKLGYRRPIPHRDVTPDNPALFYDPDQAVRDEDMRQKVVYYMARAIRTPTKAEEREQRNLLVKAEAEKRKKAQEARAKKVAKRVAKAAKRKHPKKPSSEDKSKKSKAAAIEQVDLTSDDDMEGGGPKEAAATTPKEGRGKKPGSNKRSVSNSMEKLKPPAKVIANEGENTTNSEGNEGKDSNSNSNDTESREGGWTQVSKKGGKKGGKGSKGPNANDGQKDQSTSSSSSGKTKEAPKGKVEANPFRNQLTLSVFRVDVDQDGVVAQVASESGMSETHWKNEVLPRLESYRKAANVHRMLNNEVPWRAATTTRYVPRQQVESEEQVSPPSHGLIVPANEANQQFLESIIAKLEVTIGVRSYRYTSNPIFKDKDQTTVLTFRVGPLMKQPPTEDDWLQICYDNAIDSSKTILLTPIFNVKYTELLFAATYEVVSQLKKGDPDYGRPAGFICWGMEGAKALHHKSKPISELNGIKAYDFQYRSKK